MDNKWSIIVRWLPAAALLGLSPAALSADLYRYTNDEGVPVIDYQVPPEHIKKGYEELNDKGVVIRVVPRELTEEEQRG